jgi:hypothetical protein
VAALELCPPHAGADPLDNQVSFQLRDRPDDHHDGAAQGPAGVDLLAEADELDAEPVQFVQHFKEVLHRAGNPVRGPDQDHIEVAAAGVPHQVVEAGPPGLRAGDSVGVLMDDLEAALSGHLPEIKELGLGMLVDGRDP